MTTTLIDMLDMHQPRIKSAIIGLLLAAMLPFLHGCAAMKMAYSNGQQLTWWWLDGYADFNREQTPVVKQAIGSFFDWHRRTQLPQYQQLLVQAQAGILEPITPAQACKWNERLLEQTDASIEHALGQAADLLPRLGEEQLQSIEAKYVKTNDEFKQDFMQADPERRRNAAYKRALERTERLYGSLDAAQTRVLKEGVAASPFNAELTLAERQRRQRETVQTLRKLLADKPDRATRLMALKTLVEHSEHSPDAAYRAQQLRQADYNCTLWSRLHNATTTAQRQEAKDSLKGWEDDVRSLMNAGAATTTGSGG